MTTGRSRWWCPAVAVCCLSMLVACSGGSEPANTPALPTIGATSSPAVPLPSGSSSPSPSPPSSPSSSATYQPGDPGRIGSWNTFRSPSNLNATQRDVLAAWKAYWEVTNEALNTGGSNLVGDAGLKSLQDVAVEGGQAWRLTFDGAGSRAQREIFTVGPTAFTARRIEVKGNRATVRGCMNDRSYEVDKRGKTVKAPPGSSIIADQLVRVGGRWKVSAVPYVTGQCAA